MPTRSRCSATCSAPIAVRSRRTLERLWKQRDAPRGVTFEAPRATLTYGAARPGCRRTRRSPPGADRSLSLRTAATASSTRSSEQGQPRLWHSTQATISASGRCSRTRSAARTTGRRVEVLVDGRAAAQLQLRGERDSTQQVDLSGTCVPDRTGWRCASRQGQLQYTSRPLLRAAPGRRGRQQAEHRHEL